VPCSRTYLLADIGDMFDWFKKSSGGPEQHRRSEAGSENALPFRPAKLPPRRDEQPQSKGLRLKIQLFPNWAAQDNPDGPATFYRQGSTNAFQVSWAEYRGGKPLPKITATSLEQMANAFGQKQSFGEAIESSGGECKFGSFGTAVFHSARHPRIQVWFISDSREHIMATHICDREPQSDEVAEVQQIARSLGLGL
jgi:hypothetical protein